jgi:hypothetical protein
MLKNKEKNHRFSRRHKRHRRHRNKTVSSWDKHYNYESDNDKSVSIIKSDQNNGNIVNGLKDFLQGKKVEKKGDHLSALMS